MQPNHAYLTFEEIIQILERAAALEAVVKANVDNGNGTGSKWALAEIQSTRRDLNHLLGRPWHDADNEVK